ncbi:hypothetical protein E4T56_gene12779 [Termitomyces sp. T112]|nr:hypothetical protein E4T56_gene12779 [Termitomyces sp. T112]
MCADHLPIVTKVKLPVQCTSLPPSKDFHSVDWMAFNEALTEHLSTHSPALPILTEEAFDTKVCDLTLIIQEIMNIDNIVPIRKPCPHTKRWWNGGLKWLKAQRHWADNLAYRFRDIPDHPAKAEAARLSRKMADAIQSAKESHWKEWLENIDVRQIYTANKYVVRDSSDFSCDRVPSLRTSVDGMPSMATTHAAKAEALAESFFPPPPPSPSVPLSAYPRPLPAFPGLSRDRILVAIGNLPPFKAPGPDGIPNIVLKQCADALIDHLFFIFVAVFELGVYHPSWLESTTLVLCKPGKPAYNVTKAYRPIGLLNTIGKLFSTMVAADISYLAEKRHASGGLKDQGCMGAFPNTVKDCLIHNMRERGIPTCYVQLAEHMLTGRRTKLCFDDFISDWISITNGTTQGCPLSMLYYAFYNAPLIQAACLNSKSELASGFVNDAMFLAMAKSLMETHKIIRDIMERGRGAFKWSLLYHSLFELSKLALMDFPRSHWDAAPPNIVLRRANLDSSVTAQTVDTVMSYKYLGVVFDPKLCWTAHSQKVAASAAWWTHQISRLSRISGGMPPHCMCQLYNTVAIPAFTYAADVWYTGKIGAAQRQAAKIITGTLSTMAGDVLDAHANLLPVDFLFRKVLTQAAVSTPLPSKLSKLINATPTTGLPSKAIRLTHDCASTAIYCDGSGYKGGIGALAVLYVDNKERSSLRYFLGLATKHTIYEAEIVGMTLGLHLLHGFSKQLRGLTAIGMDSQALIRALWNQRPHPTHYLLDAVHNAAENLHRKQDCLHTAPNRRFVRGTNNVWKPHSCGVIHLQVHWSPGHIDFAPHERADVLVKEAACGLSSPPSSLPTYL